jgi:hypothetical protein
VDRSIASSLLQFDELSFEVRHSIDYCNEGDNDGNRQPSAMTAPQSLFIFRFHYTMKVLELAAKFKQWIDLISSKKSSEILPGKIQATPARTTLLVDFCQIEDLKGIC